MTKKFTFLQLFSLSDGRLATKMDDIYDMLNHICDTSLMTHQLPIAYNYLKLKNPQWFQNAKSKLGYIAIHDFHIIDPKDIGFESFIEKIKEKYNEEIEVPQLKDEFNTSDFVQYMIDNSLILK